MESFKADERKIELPWDGAAHGDRALDLETAFGSARSDASSDEELLNTLARLEISAVRLPALSAAHVRTFLRRIPEDGYHFAFLRAHPAFYLLNHGTFAPEARERGRLPLARHAVEELRRQHERPVYSRAETQAHERAQLSDERVLRTFTAFMDAALDVAELRPFLLPEQAADEESEAGPAAWRSAPAGRRDRGRGAAARARTSAHGGLNDDVLERAMHASAQLDPYRHCRAAAELLEELVTAVAEALRRSFGTAQLARADDTELDVVLKLIHAYDQHGAAAAGGAEAAAEAFSQALQRAETALREVRATDIAEIQQPGVEFVRDVSYRIAAGSLTAQRRTDLAFPVLAPSLRALRFAAPANLFFYPGVVYTLLHADPLAPPSREDADRLRHFNDFARATEDALFLPAVRDGARRRRPNLREVARRTRAFYALGLTARTTAGYLTMLLASPAPSAPVLDSPAHPRTEADSLFDEVREAAEHVALTVLNARLHFLCLGAFSDTFLFHRARQLLLEQQRSVLTGRPDLTDAWQNAVLNTQRFFATRCEQDEYEALAADLPPEAREYLYRDLVHKWGDVDFPPRDTESPSSDARSVPGPSLHDVTRACLRARCSDGTEALSALLPFTAYADFEKLLAKTVLAPGLRAVINGIPNEARPVREARLLRLAYATRLLLPRRFGLYRAFVSMYNLLHYVAQPDMGLVRVLYDVAREALAQLRELTGEPPRPTTAETLGDLALEAFIRTADTDVAEAAAQQRDERQRLLHEFAVYLRRRDALLQTRATLNLETRAVTLTDATGRVVPPRLPLEAFLERLRGLRTQGERLEERLRRLHADTEHTLDRLRALSREARSIPAYTDLHFDTRGVARVSHRLQETIRLTRETLLAATAPHISRDHAFRRALDRTLRDATVLDPDRIAELGLRRCIADAAVAIAAAEAAPRPEPLGQLDEQARAVLKVWLTADGRDGVGGRAPSGPQPRTFKPKPNDPSGFDPRRERYAPASTAELEKLRRCYIESPDRAQERLLGPLRAALHQPLGVGDPQDPPPTPAP